MATTKPRPGSGRALVPSTRSRLAIVRRLADLTGPLTTAVSRAMQERHPWFNRLDSKERSWVTLVARAGVEDFVTWFADNPDQIAHPQSIFNAAPRALTRRISLQQTVDMVRTTIEVVEEQLQLLAPRGDRAALQIAIVHYSREVAFAAAEVYANAAENRGAWDEHMEALLVDGVVRADAEDSLLSRASTLGWPADLPLSVAIGGVPEAAAEGSGGLEGLRTAAEELSLSLLASVQGSRLVAVVAGATIETDVQMIDTVSRLTDHFGPSPVVVGPLVSSLAQAHESARAAMSGARVADAWPEGPRVLGARDLLPERALAGNGSARRELVETIYQPLAAAGGDLLETCASFLHHGCSVEATSRALYVHANTVRYRLKRINDVTGYSPSSARDSYVLHLAITLGLLHSAR